MIIKINRREFDVNNEDVILDNGCCYQLVTRQYYDYKSHSNHYPMMGKTQFNKLLKAGKLVLVKEKNKYITKDGKEMWYRYYRFNVDEQEIE